MPVWIVWILLNVMAADGILWLRQRGCGNGWKYMAVTHKIGGVVIVCVSNGENPCGTRLFGDDAVEQK